MLSLSSVLAHPAFKPWNRPSLTEAVFLASGLLMIAMTLMEATLIPHATISKNDLMVARIKAQKVVVAQDSLFNVDTTQYKP